MLTPANRRGIAYMAMAMGCFVVNDAMMKWAGQHLPLGQLIFTRGVMALAWVWLATRWLAQPLAVKSLRNRTLWWRSGVEAVGSAAFILSLMHLPLANATAINMAVPLVMVLLAAVWLRERVTPHQGAAVVAGFVGVLMIIQPAGSEFNAYAWLCLGATFCHAWRDLLTRRISAAVPSLHITFAGAGAVTVIAGVLSLFQGWVMPAPRVLAVLLAASLFLSAGYHSVIAAMRVGEVGVVTPFRYSGLLFALVIGWALWGSLPNSLAWWGIGLLVASGVYLLRPPRTGQR